MPHHAACGPIAVALALALALVSACGGSDRNPSATALAPEPTYPAPLPGADADSPVKIASVMKLCRKVREGSALPMTVIAFVGQRLSWQGTVTPRATRALPEVRVGSLLLTVPDSFGDLEGEAGEVVELSGVIASLDARTGRIVLERDATATPLR